LNPLVGPPGNLAESTDHPDSGPDAYSSRDDPDGGEADHCDRDERAKLSSQPVARFVEAPAFRSYLLADLLGAALSHFRAES
jgi:hypothetical protein